MIPRMDDYTSVMTENNFFLKGDVKPVVPGSQFLKSVKFYKA